MVPEVRVVEMECLNMEIVMVSLKLHCCKHVGAYYYQPRIGLSKQYGSSGCIIF